MASPCANVERSVCLTNIVYGCGLEQKVWQICFDALYAQD